MRFFILRKVIQAVVVIVLVTLATQLLSSLIPGSPGQSILGEGAGKEAIDRFNQEYGFDKPFWTRYWDWITGALHGDLGQSVQSRQPVADVLLAHLPVTLELAVVSIALSLLIAIPVAVLCATYEGGWLDRLVTAFSSGLLAIPGFVACVFLVAFFSVQAGVFPIYGWVPLTEDPWQNVVHAALPVAVLSIASCPLFLRVLRADLVTTLREDFVLAARARGLPNSYIMFRHVLRPASASLFTLAGLVFGFLMGGSIIVETYFSLPGIGQAVGIAVQANDLPIVQGVVALVAVVYVVVNTLVDTGYRLLDPQSGRQR
ncbi:ABC transporter permease [Phytohabitans flavus]